MAIPVPVEAGNFKNNIKRRRGQRGPGKATKELKEMILGALDGAGGQAYLEAQAIENPTAFLSLLGKVLPMHLNVDVRATISADPMSLDDWSNKYAESNLVPTTWASESAN